MTRNLLLPGLLLLSSCAADPAPGAGGGGTGLPPSGWERALLGRDRREAPPTRAELRGAWSISTPIPDPPPARTEDHPVLIFTGLPELWQGHARFVGAIDVGRVNGTPTFGWSTAQAHLKLRARELGADFVVIAKDRKAPQGSTGWDRVEAAAYRYGNRAAKRQD